MQMVEQLQLAEGLLATRYEHFSALQEALPPPPHEQPEQVEQVDARSVGSQTLFEELEAAPKDVSTTGMKCVTPAATGRDGRGFGGRGLAWSELAPQAEAQVDTWLGEAEHTANEEAGLAAAEEETRGAEKSGVEETLAAYNAAAEKDEQNEPASAGEEEQQNGLVKQGQAILQMAQAKHERKIAAAKVAEAKKAVEAKKAKEDGEKTVRDLTDEMIWPEQHKERERVALTASGLRAKLQSKKKAQAAADKQIYEDWEEADAERSAAEVKARVAAEALLKEEEQAAQKLAPAKTGKAKAKGKSKTAAPQEMAETVPQATQPNLAELTVTVENEGGDSDAGEMDDEELARLAEKQVAARRAPPSSFAALGQGSYGAPADASPWQPCRHEATATCQWEPCSGRALETVQPI